MRKLLVFVLVAAALVCVVSCKKTYKAPQVKWNSVPYDSIGETDVPEGVTVRYVYTYYLHNDNRIRNVFVADSPEDLSQIFSAYDEDGERLHLKYSLSDNVKAKFTDYTEKWFEEHRLVVLNRSTDNPDEISVIGFGNDDGELRITVERKTTDGVLRVGTLGTLFILIETDRDFNIGKITDNTIRFCDHLE